MDTCQKISITLSVDEWAEVVAAVSLSNLPLESKDKINSHVFDCVTREFAV